MLEFENILFIEGKPGIGKSHLVTCLTKEYNQPLVYRFWVSNQDKDYDLRLLFKNFIANISKELFGDLRRRTKDEIIQYISGIKKTVIIDGLDHVENYRPEELEYFVSFIDTLKETTKVIVLSRPLKRDIHWKKQQLVNWNFEETRLVLDELYGICCGIRNRNGRGFRHKAGRFISAGKPDFCRSCGCMEQGVWHDE